MNIKRKKLLYKFIDLQRASSFLMDKELITLSKKMVDKILSISDADFNTSNSRLSAFNGEEYCLIAEYFEKGTIEIVDACIARLPLWLWLIVKPIYLDIEALRKDITNNKIKTKEDLCHFYASKASENKYGKDYSSLYLYFVQNQDGSNFPLKYRIFHDECTPFVETINECYIQGNFHNHSLYSDGRHSLEELKSFAISANRKYIGISDHSHYVGGVTSEQLIAQAYEINLINTMGGPILLKGIECEILKDGSLDMDASTLSNLDYVIVACHRDELMNKRAATDRIIKAIENEYSNILAHPLARIYQKKVGLYIDMYKVIDACIANQVAIEINGDPNRLDLSPEYIEYAINHGAMFTVDSDTHTKHSFKNINNAVKIAEDFLIPSETILNVKPLNDLKLFFNK